MSKGRKLALIFTTLGLSIAVIVLITLFPSDKSSFSPISQLFVEFPIHFIMGLFSVYISAFFIGGKVEQLIMLDKGNYILVGIMGSFIVLLLGALAISLIALLSEGLAIKNYSVSSAFFDYVFKPIYWIFFFGGIPTLIIGILFGWLIKKEVKKVQNNK